VQVEMRKM